MVYRPPYPWYIDPPNSWYFDPPSHGISTPLPMVYQTLSYGRNEGEFNLPWVGSKYDKKLTPYPWYIDPPNHGISIPLTMIYRPPYPWYIDTPTHGISTPLPMVYWPPPTHGILTPLPMEYRPPYLWYIKPSLMVEMRGSSIYHEWVQNMTKNWPWGQNTIWKIEPVVKISYKSFIFIRNTWTSSSNEISKISKKNSWFQNFPKISKISVFIKFQNFQNSKIKKKHFFKVQNF